MEWADAAAPIRTLGIMAHHRPGRCPSRVAPTAAWAGNARAKWKHQRGNEPYRW